MGSNIAPIVVANGDQSSSVWAFRQLIATPLIQYGTVVAGSGGSGTVTITIPTPYASISSYVVQVTMKDSPAAQMYATPTSPNTITVGWSSGGPGTQKLMWTTIGT
jgi:hypothetical protein